MKFFPIILLFISVTSFLVYEKIPLNTYVAKIRKDLKEIFAYNAIKELTFNDFIFNFNEEEYILTSVKAKALFFNSFMPEITIKDQASLSFKSSWTAPNTKNYISPYHAIYSANITYESKNYSIEFELESDKFEFIKTWELYEQDKFYIPKGEVNSTFIVLKAKNLDESSPLTEEGLLTIINDFINQNEGKMNDYLNSIIESYYKSLSFEEWMQRIYIKTNNIPKENNIDLTLEVMPEYYQSSKKEDFIIFKRKGTLNGEQTEEGSIQEDDISTQTFNLHGSIYQKLILQNKFDIQFEQTNNPASKYQLTGEYLRKVAKLKTTIEDSLQLKLEAKMGNITFDTTNPMIGNVIFGISIISKDDLSALFAFDINTRFRFTPTLFQNGLNFLILSKYLSSDITPNPEYEILDGNLLKEWIENTYLCSLSKNEYNLFEIPFDLSYYFNTNDLKFDFLENYLSVIKN